MRILRVNKNSSGNTWRNATQCTLGEVLTLSIGTDGSQFGKSEFFMR